MNEEEKARRELESLTLEHRELDDKINELMTFPNFDQLLVQRLKRRKLAVKDRIKFLREMLFDDIVA